jgi:DNA-binding response OmpR family regulator
MTTTYANPSIFVDFWRREVVRGETREPVELTPTQWRLVTVFIQNKGRALSREMIHDCCKNPEIVDDTIKWHISMLRKQLGDAFPIITLRGFGYRYDG